MAKDQKKDQSKKTLHPDKRVQTPQQILLNILFIAIVVLTYTYGWKVTEIDLG
jgi:hypothetical protein